MVNTRVDLNVVDIADRLSRLRTREKDSLIDASAADVLEASPAVEAERGEAPPPSPAPPFLVQTMEQRRQEATASPADPLIAIYGAHYARIVGGA